MRKYSLVPVAPIMRNTTYLGRPYWIFTLGWEFFAVRITRGHLDRHGHFHDNWPDIFFLWGDRRVG